MPSKSDDLQRVIAVTDLDSKLCKAPKAERLARKNRLLEANGYVALGKEAVCNHGNV